MEKIDRLGWSAGISMVAYGLRIGIRTNQPAIMERVMDLLPPGWARAKSANVEGLYSLRVGSNGGGKRVRQFTLLYSGIERIMRTENIDDALASLELSLRHYVAEYAKTRLFVHAGVVGWKGKAILIPGRTFSGKSNLVAELVRSGATYYSDEYAVLDSRGRVHPYTRPLSLREEGSAEQKETSVEELGGAAGVEPLPVGLVVVSQYKTGASWKPRKLSNGQGALELLANTVPARRRPDAALEILKKVVSRAPVLKGNRGEATEMVEATLSSITP